MGWVGGKGKVTRGLQTGTCGPGQVYGVYKGRCAFGQVRGGRGAMISEGWLILDG